MNSPMEMSLKKLCGEVVGHDLENPFKYRQLFGTLMFLENTERTYVLQSIL